MDEVIQVRGLVKRYGRLTAVDGVSFTVRRGEVFGILGPNGAGKTTTLEVIEGLQVPTQGETRVLGMDVRRDPAQVKGRIGVQLQSSAYFDYLTLHEILALFGSFYPRSVPANDLLEMVGLADRRGATLKKLSGGQKQRFTVAASLVNDPEVVILDEPTTGLDPQARRNLWELIQRIHSNGRTVVLTTHYMEEAEALCDRVAIMDAGRLAALDTPSGLLLRMERPHSVKLSTSREPSPQEMESLTPAPEDALTGGGVAYEIRTKDAPRAMAHVLHWASERGIALDRLEVRRATLEDVFLELTGKELRG